MLLCRHWLVPLITLWTLRDTIQAICRRGYSLTDGPRQLAGRKTGWQPKQTDEKQPSESFDTSMQWDEALHSSITNHFINPPCLISNALINSWKKQQLRIHCRVFTVIMQQWDQHRFLLNMHDDFVITYSHVCNNVTNFPSSSLNLH